MNYSYFLLVIILFFPFLYPFKYVIAQWCNNKVFMLFCPFPQWLTAPPLDRSSRTGRTAPGTTALSVCPWRTPATRETSSVRLIHIYKYSTCTDTFSASLWVYFPRRILTIFSEIYFMALYVTTLHKCPTSTVMWFNYGYFWVHFP